MPKLNAKFRKRNGVPYAVEYLTGKQFRCRHCNEIFLAETDLDGHIKQLLKTSDREEFRVSAFCPKVSSNTDVRVLYTYHIGDRMKRQWLTMKQGDEYDGAVK